MKIEKIFEGKKGKKEEKTRGKAQREQTKTKHFKLYVWEKGKIPTPFVRERHGTVQRINFIHTSKKYLRTYV